MPATNLVIAFLGFPVDERLGNSLRYSAMRPTRASRLSGAVAALRSSVSLIDAKMQKALVSVA